MFTMRFIFQPFLLLFWALSSELWSGFPASGPEVPGALQKTGSGRCQVLLFAQNIVHKVNTNARTI